ncbi:MAG: phosphoadenosine phosphosulfate reductase domain-containing protein [Candidatus Helarchaeota archaeon]
MPSKVFLGPNLNFWCNNCNIPIFELKKCPLCQSKLKKLEITPPFEVTPAFEKDLHLIRKIIDQQYGKNIGTRLIPSNKIVLLNKAPYYDRMDEVILDGFVLGNFRFNPSVMRWEFIPKIEGARRLAQMSSQKWLQVDEGAVNYITKGANVLAPGVIEYDSSFKEGDLLIILTPKRQAIATGPAKYSAKDLKHVQRGMVVKTKDHDFPKDPLIRKGGQDWNLVLEANKQVIERRARKAKNFIRKTVEKFKDYPIAISFSGGKDSLCLLLLVKEVLGPVDIFFIDTGIEFEETVNFTKEIIKEFKLEDRFFYKKSRESFWDNLDKFGPPSKDYRWCCKVIKLANITEHLNQQYPNTKVVTFIGSRQYESITRHQEKKIWTNTFLPQQISVSPIHDWPSLLVWLYLLSKHVKINPLYFEGYKRIGCIYCPATKLSELQLLKELHPELYTRWMEFLKNWAKKYHLSPLWAERGFWRSRKFKERGQLKLATELGIPSEKIIWQKDEKLKFHLAQGINPCQNGSFSIEGHIEGYLHFTDIANHLSILGKVKYSSELGIISLRADNLSLNLFSDGTITIRGTKERLAQNLPLIKSLIKRANECIGCGICISLCPNDALFLKNQKIKVGKNCNGCLSCLEKCPVLKYSD